MKKILASLILFCITVISVKAQSITANEAAKHIGDTVTVCGKIFGGKYFDKSDKKITLLNMGAAYPKSPLTIVIAAEDRKNFEEAPELFYDGKEVCIKGVIKEFKGKPQIFIAKPEEVIIK